MHGKRTDTSHLRKSWDIWFGVVGVFCFLGYILPKAVPVTVRMHIEREDTYW